MPAAPNTTPSAQSAAVAVEPVRSSLRAAAETTSAVSSAITAKSAVANLWIGKAEALSAPVVAGAIKIGDPVVTKVDEALGQTVDAVQRNLVEPTRQITLDGVVVRVENAWFERVDQVTTAVRSAPTVARETAAKAQQLVLASPDTARDAAVKVQEYAQVATTAFFTAATDAYVKLAAEGARVTSDEFRAELQQSLQGAWDERLVQPADAFYKVAQEKAAVLATQVKDTEGNLSLEVTLTNTQAGLSRTWAETILPVFEDKVSRPSQELYQTALTTYRTTDVRASVTDFVARVRESLGRNWNEKLETPVREFWAEANKAYSTDFWAAHNALDADQSGYISLGDLIGSSKSATNVLSTFAAARYQGALETTENIVDCVVPPTQERAAIEHKPVAGERSISGLTTQVTTRIADRAQIAKDQTLAQAQVFQKRVEPAFTEVKNRINARVQPVLSTAQEQITQAQEQASQVYHTVSGTVTATASTVTQTVTETANTVTQTVTETASVAADVSGLNTANAYVKQQLEQVNNRVVIPVTEKVTEQVGTVKRVVKEQVENVNTRVVVPVTETVNDKVVAPITSKVNEQVAAISQAKDQVVQNVVDTVTPIRDEFTRRASASVDEGKNLANYSAQYAHDRQLTAIPSDSVRFVGQIPQLFLARKTEEFEPSHTQIKDTTNAWVDVFRFSSWNDALSKSKDAAAEYDREVAEAAARDAEARKAAGPTFTDKVTAQVAERASLVSQQVSDKASQVSQQVSDRASQVSQQVSDRASQVTQQVSETATQVTKKATDAAYYASAQFRAFFATSGARIVDDEEQDQARALPAFDAPRSAPSATRAREMGGEHQREPSWWRQMSKVEKEEVLAKSQWSYPKSLAYVKETMKSDFAEDIIAIIDAQWRRIDVDDSGIIDTEELRDAIWQHENPNSATPEQLPAEMQEVADGILEGTGNKGEFDFFEFANYVLGEEDYEAPAIVQPNEPWARV